MKKNNNKIRGECSYAKKYKAVREPICGCESCNNKWNKKKKVIKAYAI